jgi:small-conductance mechanosensitive channel
VTLPHDIAAATAREALEQAVRRVPRLEPEPAPYIASTAVGKDDQQFEARFWLRSADHETLAIVSSVVLALQEAVQDLKRRQAVLAAEQAAAVDEPQPS